ncbi:hypothetical protein ABFG93_04620 [Pseudalkalibacillus hwajinpoensis]|uniref:hypothetical protein n=1 Tax=Guptibacillus hwajinpoensis TaxID=208199 RepID=UPI00325B2969
MDIIFSQPFVKVVRKIERNEQKTIEQEHALTLYEDRISVGQEYFAIKDVFDVSYRFTSALYGFLYLHTKSGVVSFIIKKDPTLFIEEYRKLV